MRPSGWRTGPPRCWPAGVASPPTGSRGPRAWPLGCGRRTSRCCAASARSSCRCGTRWRPAASRSRWWAWAGCSRCPRCRTWCAHCGCCTTRAPPTRWPGCSPGRACGSGRATWSRSAAARALATGEGDGRAVTRAAAVEQDAQDALAEAVTDLTAESGSLVEALDDLGEPAAYSRAGYTRMHALAGELRRLRAHIGRPLADLTAEAERVLGLDIEVA